ncbi:hypothetical protein [Nioella sp.]|uniref:hypothetical protein n=1 Tax=Nioella sp. TaxID=1912091 RepID=UPI003A862463
MARDATTTVTLAGSTSGSARAICRFWFATIPSATASLSNAWRNAALPLVKKMMMRKARIISFSFGIRAWVLQLSLISAKPRYSNAACIQGRHCGVPAEKFSISFKENISATTIAAMVAFGPKSYLNYFLQLFRIQKALRALGV